MYIAIWKHGETVEITFIANVVAGGIQAANFPAKSNAQHSTRVIASPPTSAASPKLPAIQRYPHHDSATFPPLPFSKRKR